LSEDVGVKMSISSYLEGSYAKSLPNRRLRVNEVRSGDNYALAPDGNEGAIPEASYGTLIAMIGFSLPPKSCRA